MNSKAQGWGFDLIMASFLFFIGLAIFYLYTINYPTEGQETLDNLFYEGNFISENILSEGFPANWDETTAVRIGILTEDKVNETKLENLYNLANQQANPSGYEKTKSLLNTNYDFFFNFSEPITINGSPITEQGIGKSLPSNPENLIKITRITVYKNKPVTLNLHIWEE